MFKFTSFFKKRFSNFLKLPNNVTHLFDSKLKITAYTIVDEFRSGILNDSLGLARLKEKTIEVKRRKRLKNPNKPLVGKGATSNNSYANMMEVTKIDKGYMIKPKNKLHHSNKVTLADLFKYHEDAQRKDTPKRPALQIVLSKTKEVNFKLVIDPKTFMVRMLKK